MRWPEGDYAASRTCRYPQQEDATLDVYEDLCPYPAKIRAALCAACVKKSDDHPPCAVNWIRQRMTLMASRTREEYRKAA